MLKLCSGRQAFSGSFVASSGWLETVRRTGESLCRLCIATNTIGISAQIFSFRPQPGCTSTAFQCDDFHRQKPAEGVQKETRASRRSEPGIVGCKMQEAPEHDRRAGADRIPEPQACLLMISPLSSSRTLANSSSFSDGISSIVSPVMKFTRAIWSRPDSACILN